MRKLIESTWPLQLICDNEKCDFTHTLTSNDDAYLGQLINTRCPMCGENLLTREDYLRYVYFKRTVNFINRWFSWITIFYSKKKLTQSKTVSVHCHNGIKVEEIHPSETKRLLKTPKCPVNFKGRKFYGIREFDCVIVSLFTEETLQGGYFTAIPISNAKYREEYPTKAKVIVTKVGNWTVFDIYSDWGELSIMRIHNSLSKEIDFAIKSAREKNLLKD